MSVMPGCMNCSTPLPGTWSILSTVSGSSSDSCFFSARSYSVTRIGTLIRLAVGNVSSPRSVKPLAGIEVRARV